jgi:hypothetical protein
MNQPTQFFWTRVNHFQMILRTKAEGNTVADAKIRIQMVSQSQKELRLLRTELVATMKAVRADGRLHRATTQENVGISLFLGRRSARTVRAGQREGSRQQEAQVIADYEKVRHAIDTLLLEMDRYKLQLQQWIAARQ